MYGHAEGDHTNAGGTAAHAEGSNTSAGNYSHAEGYGTTVTGEYSHAEGYTTTVGGSYAHAEGSRTVANGNNSHVEGDSTVTSVASQHVQGQFNINDSEGRYADIVGWGTSDAMRKNISSLTKTGELHLKKEVYINANNDGTGGIKLVPSITGNAKKVLAVNSEGTQLEWVAVSGGTNADWPKSVDNRTQTAN